MRRTKPGGHATLIFSAPGVLAFAFATGIARRVYFVRSLIFR